MDRPSAEVLRAVGLPADTRVAPAAGGASGVAWRVDTEGDTFVLRDAGSSAQAEGRLAAMQAARAAGLPAPDLIARASIRGTQLVLLSWLPGTPMLDALADASSVRRMGEAAGVLQRRLHGIVAPEPVVAAISDPGRPFGAGAGLPDVPDADRLLHLDWHPLNLLVDADAGVITGIVDWDNARRGHPLLDLARTYTLLNIEPALGTLPQAIRAVTGEFAAAWAKGYGPEARSIPAACLRWAGEVMLADLEPRYGAAAVELEPVRRWAASLAG